MQKTAALRAGVFSLFVKNLATGSHVEKLRGYAPLLQSGGGQLPSPPPPAPASLDESTSLGV